MRILTRSARAALALGAAAPLAVAGAQGVRWQSPRFRVELGAAGSGAFLTDGNGLEVRAGLAPTLGLAAAWPAGHRYAISMFGRASRASVKLSQGGSHWSAGSTRQLDLGAAIERRFRGDVFEARLGGGGSWLAGPDDVAPFRFLSSGTPRLSGEVGGSVRLHRSLPVYGVVTAQGVRYGGANATAPEGGSGYVTRLIGGVRYGR
jgi:hypothetical protein